MSCANKNSKRLYDIVDKVLTSFLNTANIKCIKLNNNVPINLGDINGNSDIIMFLLVNLIDNAIKFTSGQGLIEVGAKEKSKELKVWVRDTGIGIPNKLHKKIFERQFRYNGYRGKGIGLSMAQRIVNFYGGKIWVESEIGKGSTFVFTIPN